MSSVQRFAEALQELERNRDLNAFLRLFSDRVRLLRPEVQEDEYGKSGTSEFWQAYLGTFERISSTFLRLEQSGSLAELEWIGEGHLSTGRQVSYRGVSLLEFDDSGLVSRFATYYDTAAFLTAPSE